MSNRNYKGMGDEKLIREAPIAPPEDWSRVDDILRERGMEIPDRSAKPAETSVFKKLEKPMLAQAGAIKEGPEYVMERKLDGWRLMAVKRDGKVTCYTRTGKVMDSLPYINRALSVLPDGTIVDGEIVDLAGDTEWNRTQTLCSRKSPHVPTEDNPMLTYVLFDVVEAYEEDITKSRLWARRERLQLLYDTLLHGREQIQLIEQVPAAESGYQELVDAGAEGVVIKHVSSIYEWGKRSKYWIKVKPVLETDATIIGTYAAEAGSKYDGSHVGGILFRLPNGVEGKASGMDDELRRDLYTDGGAYIGRVVELHYGGVGEDGALRFPRFRRLRDPADKEDVNG